MIKYLFGLLMNKILKRKTFVFVLGYPEDNRLQAQRNAGLMDAYDALHTNKMTVFVNAPFLREERSEFYKKFKEQTDIPITLLYYELNYAQFRELHSDKPINVINQLYARLEPPVKSVDCDRYVTANE